jgi:hypothetical protein
MANWLEVLKAECDQVSQACVARRLGVSGAMINQALKGLYKGNLSRLETLVRGTFMQETVECPVLTRISKRQCMDEQARPFAPTNPQRVQVYLACKDCSNRAGSRNV